MSHPTFCLVADASCDIPAQALTHPQLRVLPVHVFVGDEQFYDQRDAVATQRFYSKSLTSSKAVHGRSEPMGTEDMVAAFNTQLATQFDQMLGVFVASSRSAIYQRAKTAVSQARRDAFALRARAGKIEILQADCLDSQAFFAGYGVQVMDLLDLLDKGAGIADAISHQHMTAPQTYAYMAPGEVTYILQRAALKGEKSVSALAGFAAKALSITPILRGHMGQTEPVGRKLGKINAREAVIEMALRMVKNDLLLSQHICFSYSGPLKDIERMDSFRQLVDLAKTKRAKVHLTLMSMTGSVNVGPGALVLGVLAKPHQVDDLL
jgi:DegV family protein with EDD domain